MRNPLERTRVEAQRLGAPQQRLQARLRQVRAASQGGIDINEVGVPGQGGFPSTEEEYERYGISAYARLGSGLGLTAGYRTTSDGKNTGDVDAYTVGIVYGN